MKAATQRLIAQRRLAMVTERTKLRPGNESPAYEPRMVQVGCDMGATGGTGGDLFFAAYLGEIRALRSCAPSAFRIQPASLRPMLRWKVI